MFENENFAVNAGPILPIFWNLILKIDLYVSIFEIAISAKSLHPRLFTRRTPRIRIRLGKYCTWQTRCHILRIKYVKSESAPSRIRGDILLIL